MKTKIILSGLAFLGIFALVTSCSKTTDGTDNVVSDLKSAEVLYPDCPYLPTASDSAVAACCTVTGTLSDTEAAGLLFMREEEKMAHDVYSYLYDKYKLLVFKNITKSESAHMRAVLSLINGFEVADNSSDDPGVFANTQIQELYAQLITMGNLSLEDALKVGYIIETTDINDLETRLAETENASVKTVYTHLLAGSNIHLKAFTWNLTVRGIALP